VRVLLRAMERDLGKREEANKEEIPCWPEYKQQFNKSSNTCVKPDDLLMTVSSVEFLAGSPVSFRKNKARRNFYL
jgi:hypothetical protein